jgi:hypothetical protein
MGSASTITSWLTSAKALVALFILTVLCFSLMELKTIQSCAESHRASGLSERQGDAVPCSDVGIRTLIGEEDNRIGKPQGSASAAGSTELGTPLDRVEASIHSVSEDDHVVAVSGASGSVDRTPEAGTDAPKIGGDHHPLPACVENGPRQGAKGTRPLSLCYPIPTGPTAKVLRTPIFKDSEYPVVSTPVDTSPEVQRFQRDSERAQLFRYTDKMDADPDPWQHVNYFAPRRNLSAMFPMASHVRPDQRRRLFDVCNFKGALPEERRTIQIAAKKLKTVAECRSALRKFVDTMYTERQWADMAYDGILGDIEAITLHAVRKLTDGDELTVWRLVLHTLSYGTDTGIFSSIRSTLRRVGYRLPFLLSRVQSYLHRPYDFDTHAVGMSGILTGKFSREKVDIIAKSLDETGSYVLPGTLPQSVVDSIISQVFQKCVFHRGKTPYDPFVSPNAVQEAGYSPACHKRISEHNDFTSLTTDPNILAALQEYFNSHPILGQVNAFWSGHMPKPSNNQIFHQDADFMMFTKMFIYLSDQQSVDDGPHTFMPRSMRFMHDLSGGMGTRYSDNQAVKSLAPKHDLKVERVLGLKGQAVIVDTHNLHRGQNPAPKHARIVIILEWVGSWYSYQVMPKKDRYPRPLQSYAKTAPWEKFASKFPRVLEFACNMDTRND